MNKNIIGGLLFLFLLSFVKINAQNYDQSHRDNDRDRDKPVNSDWHDKKHEDNETRRTIKELEERLNNLELNLPRMRPKDRDYIHQQIVEIINILENLKPKEEVRRIAPMSEGEFNELFSAIVKEPFSKGKQQIIFGSANQNFFTIEQIIRILTQFSFDDEKLTIVKVLYPKVLNQDRNYRLYDSFTFSSSKDKLGDYLNSLPKQEMPH